MRDTLTSIVSIYGTADAGVIAVETPLTVALRRWLAARPADAAALFGHERLPSLLQYDPYNRYLETHPQDGGWVGWCAARVDETLACPPARPTTHPRRRHAGGVVRGHAARRRAAAAILHRWVRGWAGGLRLCVLVRTA